MSVMAFAVFDYWTLALSGGIKAKQKEESNKWQISQSEATR